MRKLFIIALIVFLYPLSFSEAQEEDGLKLEEEAEEVKEPAAKAEEKEVEKPKEAEEAKKEEAKEEKEEASSQASEETPSWAKDKQNKEESKGKKADPDEEEGEDQEEGEEEKVASDDGKGEKGEEKAEEGKVEPIEETFVPWSLKEGVPVAEEDKKDYKWTGGIRFFARSRMAENMEDLNGNRRDFDFSIGHRFRGFLEFAYKESLKIKAALQDARLWGSEKSYGVEDLWLNGLSHGYGTVLHEGYVELDRPGGAPIVLRIGRMELAYGSELLIGRNDWHFVSNAFDAALFKLTFEEFDADLFYSRVRADQIIVHPYGPCSQTFDRAGCMASGEHLGGLNFHVKALDWFTIDVYGFLQKSSPKQAETLTTGDFTSDDRTLGTVGLFISDKGKGPAIYKGEIDVQFGKVPSALLGAEPEKHLALAAMLEGGWRGETIKLKPQLWAGYAFATGDDKPAPEDKSSGKFYQLYPSNHERLGIMDLKDLSNVHNINLNARIYPIDELDILLSFHYFISQKYRDGWTDASGERFGKQVAPGLRTFKGFYDAEGNSGLPLGLEIDFVLGWKPLEGFKLLSEMGLFIPGTFPKTVAEKPEMKLDGINQILGGDPAFMWSLTAEASF